MKPPQILFERGCIGVNLSVCLSVFDLTIFLFTNMIHVQCTDGRGIVQGGGKDGREYVQGGKKTGGNMSRVGKRREGVCPGWEKDGKEYSRVGKRWEGIWPGWEKREGICLGWQMNGGELPMIHLVCLHSHEVTSLY